MAVNYARASEYIAQLLKGGSLDTLMQRLGPKPGARPSSVPGGALISAKAVERRWSLLGADVDARRELLDDATQTQMQVYRRNIEHFIGTVKMPVGIAGPLRVNGLFAQGDFYVPLATTEATLVASYSRGAVLVTEAGGTTAVLLNEGVSRSPVFVFRNFTEVGLFLKWALANLKHIKRAAEATTAHGKVIDLQVNVEGNHVFLLMVYSTGDAAGQNIVTIATDAAVAWLVEHSPVKPSNAYVEANFSGDKKASAQALQTVRGKKVSAEATIPAELVVRRLHTTPEQIVEYSRIATMGGVLSGTLGIQAHYANGLTALFVACGQDAASICEASVGTTRFNLTPEGALYACVTLPNLIVGTVGGGTALPSQAACLKLMGLAGSGGARAFAEVAASVCLAGELSITGAMSAGEFTRAHARRARRRRLRPHNNRTAQPVRRG